MSNDNAERAFEKELDRKFNNFRVIVDISFKLDDEVQKIDLEGRGEAYVLSRSQELDISIGSLSSTNLEREPRKATILKFMRNQKGVKEKIIETNPMSFSLEYSNALGKYMENKDWIRDIEISIEGYLRSVLKNELNQDRFNIFEIYDDESEKSVKVKFKVESVHI